MVADLLRQLFDQGVAAARAEACLLPHLPVEPFAGKTMLLALGKAAGDMARVALDRLEVDAGLVVTRYGHVPPGWHPPGHIRVIEAGHPFPDDASMEAGAQALKLVSGLGANDRLIALISGGGSSLMTMPLPGVTLEDKRAISRALMDAGAPIGAINIVRQALSAIKGGKLAQAAAPARVLTYIISDVPGDEPSLVASGPTLRPPSRDKTANEILEQYGVPVAPHIHNIIGQQPVAAEGAANDSLVICATSATALEAAAAAARAAGFVPIILGSDLEEDARRLARQHANLARDHQSNGERVALISGGEATVTLAGNKGRGGRCGSYALELALALDGTAGIWATAGDTDGIDGNSDAAGAIVTPDSVAQARAAGIDPAAYQLNNRSHDVFDAIGDLIMTGPTFTNVNDLRIVLTGV
jgi:glycerate 2-kinase